MIVLSSTGSGELTLELARAVGASGSIVGHDASSDMVEKATALYRAVPSSSDLASVSFLVQDGHDPILPSQYAQFDKVFSNAALHWMKRSPSQVLSSVHSSLKPGGRFAAELGGFMNCIGVRSHLHLALRKRDIDATPLDPWFFPSAAQYTTLLQAAGFTVDNCELVPRLTPLPKETGLKGWLRTFAGPFLNAIESEEERQAVVNEVVEALKPDAYDVDSGVWSVMYVRLRVLAHKQA